MAPSTSWFYDLRQTSFWKPISWVYRNSGLKARVKTRSICPPVKTVPLSELVVRLNAGAPLRTRKTTPFQLPPNTHSGPMPQYDQDALLDLLTRLDPKTIFEFGTNWGITTSYFVENTNAKIWTLDIHRELLRQITSGCIPEGDLAMVLTKEESGSAYRQLPESVGRVTPVFQDSLKLDWTESDFPDAFDLILVDACHEYPFVKSDTEKAFRKLRPGGLLLWHDFYSNFVVWPGVFMAISEFAKEHPGVVNIKGTSLAAWVKPR